jgi:hypothetical protein
VREQQQDRSRIEEQGDDQDAAFSISGLTSIFAGAFWAGRPNRRSQAVERESVKALVLEPLI